ncbi:MAG: 16S rRNA (guanine(527)-N(7))-methyltransferase RsmG [Candidatus Korobacteraceae bacterium]
MNASRIAELLQPFTGEFQLPPGLIEQVQAYLELLLRWNARINLTAVRDPEQIVTRHFGESLFASQLLARGFPADRPNHIDQNPEDAVTSLADVGSGAGFPGIPIKLIVPQLELTLIESHNKKAVFLREVLRLLNLDHAHVFCGRAEQWGKRADVITLRGVEQFERVLSVAASLVTPHGRLCLLIGAAQVGKALGLLGETWKWEEPVAIPGSTERVALIGRRDH